MTTENLWGALPQPDQRRSPKQILREQAAILSDATKNTLEGEVLTYHEKDAQGRIVLMLAINAPTLGNYRFDVLTVHFDPLLFYPAAIGDKFTDQFIRVSSEEELVKALRTILQSPRLREVIAALLRQATDEDSTLIAPPSDEIPF